MGSTAVEAAEVTQRPCESARTLYKDLSFDKAQNEIDRWLKTPERPLDCLEVLGLMKLVSEQQEAATAAFTELFERAPDYTVQEASLTPTQEGLIARIKAQAQPLQVSVRARWLYHEAVRLSVQLKGGLRGAHKIRFRTQRIPEEVSLSAGEMSLIGRVGSATVAVPARVPMQRMRMSGQVLDRLGRSVHPFSAELLLVERPAPVQGAVVIKTQERSSMPWYLWVVIGVASAGAIAAGVTAGVLAQPDLPNPEGVGRTTVDL